MLSLITFRVPPYLGEVVDGIGGVEVGSIWLDGVVVTASLEQAPINKLKISMMDNSVNIIGLNNLIFTTYPP